MVTKMIRNIVNVSAGPVTISDFNGITIGVGETIDGLQFGLQKLDDSDDLIQELLSGTLALNDGTYTYETGRAINLLKNNVDQLTKDGKRIITASDRPKDHYRHYSSAGDDLSTGVRGDGQELIFIVPPGQTQVIDAKFIDDIYIKDGMAFFQDAEIGSHISVHIVAPIGTPYPAIFGNGNTDIVNGQIIANTNQTGDYFIDAVKENVFLRFMHKHLILGTERLMTSAPEPSFLPTPCSQRFVVYNASTTKDLNVVIVMGLYRTHTL